MVGFYRHHHYYYYQRVQYTHQRILALGRCDMYPRPKYFGGEMAASSSLCGTTSRKKLRTELSNLRLKVLTRLSNSISQVEILFFVPNKVIKE